MLRLLSAALAAVALTACDGTAAECPRVVGQGTEPIATGIWIVTRDIVLGERIPGYPPSNERAAPPRTGC